MMVLLGALPGLVAGGAGLAVALIAARRQGVAVGQVREELLVMLTQQRTELMDGVADVGHGVDSLAKSVAFLEQSSLQTEDTLRDRLTPSVRSKAIQLLRSGIPADTAASTLTMARSDVRLIAAVTKTLAPR
jgi:hypothetical protein